MNSISRSRIWILNVNLCLRVAHSAFVAATVYINHSDIFFKHILALLCYERRCRP